MCRSVYTHICVQQCAHIGIYVCMCMHVLCTFVSVDTCNDTPVYAYM